VTPPTPTQTYVVIGIPVLLLGGTEMQTLNLVRVLVPAGYRVKVCCYYEYDESVVAMFRHAGAEVMLMKRSRPEGAWVLIKALRSVFKNEKPDIVHIQYVAPGLQPILAARLAGVSRLMATVHQPGRTVGLKARTFLRVGAALTGLFICVSQAAERSWFGDGFLYEPTGGSERRRHCTIYNAVDTERIARLAGLADTAAMKLSLGIGSGPVIGIVARLRGEKGQAVLLNAMPAVLAKYPDAALLVAGDGPDRDLLRRQADALGLSRHVHWLGALPQDETFKLYSVIDIAVVPSLFEGFGLSAAEAMAAGRPVVASAVDGLAEVVQDGVTGMLFPPSDAGALANCLTWLIADPARARQMGQAGLSRAAEMFSMERFSRVTLAICRDVLAGIKGTGA
jgi:glycosyltransferase involved in cell wall biosynthesis